MVTRSIVVAAIASVVWTAPTAAYWGNSFLSVPGIAGDWKGADHKGWIRVVSNYWKSTGTVAVFNVRRMQKCGSKEFRTCHSGPVAPRDGASAVMIAVDKRNPALPHLMDKCLKNAPIAEVTFAESAERVRNAREVGARPSKIPEYFEYALKDVRLTHCAVVADAPEQAFVVNFNDITWLNYDGDAEGEPTNPPPAALKPVKSSGATKAFVIEWFGPAHDADDNQCRAMNSKPTENEYYALMSKEDAARERAEMSKRGGVGGGGGVQMALRGPNKLNATLLPGIVPDPGNAEPQTKFAFGLNLDGDDGTGPVPAGTCKHKNYVSADGRTGIDNQLFTVQGCSVGYLGRKGKGFGAELFNGARRDGREKAASLLVEVSGIDNERNDESVEVRVLYSEDRMAKNADGKMILPDYSFRVTDRREYSSLFAQLRGRLVNGVVITETAKSMRFALDFGAPWGISNVQMRVELLQDGSMKGLIGGYLDWRELMMSDPMLEHLWGYQVPGFYNAFKRAADGLKDPVTGECDGVSSAFEVYGVPAFVTHGQRTMQNSKATVGN